MGNLENSTVDYSTAKNQDLGQEKHVPVVTGDKSSIHVRVGSIPHPMEDKHYIEWIEIHTNLDTYRKDLGPTDLPEASFSLDADEQVMSVYAFCNLHGLWVMEMPKRIRTSSCAGEVMDWHSSR